VEFSGFVHERGFVQGQGELYFARHPGILAPSLALALRAAVAFAFAILQTQSRSDIRDPVTSMHYDKSLGSGFRRNDERTD